MKLNRLISARLTLAGFLRLLQDPIYHTNDVDAFHAHHFDPFFFSVTKHLGDDASVGTYLFESFILQFTSQGWELKERKKKNLSTWHPTVFNITSYKLDAFK